MTETKAISVVKRVEADPWAPYMEVACAVRVDMPVPAFTIAQLLALKPEDIVDTQRAQTEDVPVAVGGQIIAGAKFEVIGDRLAVRISELS